MDNRRSENKRTPKATLAALSAEDDCKGVIGSLLTFSIKWEGDEEPARLVYKNVNKKIRSTQQQTLTLVSAPNNPDLTLAQNIRCENPIAKHIQEHSIVDRTRDKRSRITMALARLAGDQQAGLLLINDSLWLTCPQQHKTLLLRSSQSDITRTYIGCLYFL